jgi:hypothetical protein
MKKLFVLLLLVVVTMSFSSCAPIFWGDPYGPHYYHHHHYHAPKYEYYPYDRW